MKRRYTVFLALIAYFFVIGFFQYPGFNSDAYVLGFTLGGFFGFLSGVLFMWWTWGKFLEGYGLRIEYRGWRAWLLKYGPKVARVASIFLAFTVGFFLIQSVIRYSGIFGGSAVLETYSGIAVLLLTAAVALARDAPDYSGRLDEVVLQLDRIRRLLKKSRRRRYTTLL